MDTGKQEKRGSPEEGRVPNAINRRLGNRVGDSPVIVDTITHLSVHKKRSAMEDLPSPLGMCRDPPVPRIPLLPWNPPRRYSHLGDRAPKGRSVCRHSSSQHWKLVGNLQSRHQIAWWYWTREQRRTWSASNDWITKIRLCGRWALRK